MIIDCVRGDIFEADLQHIAFAVNTEGFNDSGFAGVVAKRYWPALANTEPKQLGEVLSREVDSSLTFHALVCHELRGSGWGHAPKHIENCLNSLDVPQDEVIGVVAIGAGMVGRMAGADLFANLGAIARSNKACKVYTL